MSTPCATPGCTHSIAGRPTGMILSRRPLPRALTISPVRSTSLTFSDVSSLTRRPVE